LFHTTVKPIDDRLSRIWGILQEVVEDVGMQYTIVHNSMIKPWLQYLNDKHIDDLTDKHIDDLTDKHIDDLTASSVDLFKKIQELSMFLLDMWEGIRLV
jgi:hypothetical protein